jgi:hypothetical protein
MYRAAAVVILATFWLGQGAFAQTTSCNGGANVGVRVKISNAPTTTASTTLAALPGAVVSFSVPAGATRRFIVSFSGETRLINNNATMPADNWIELQVMDNGHPMQPQDNTSPLAFAAGNVYESHAATFCRTVTNTTSAAVTHTISVHWKVTDNDALGNLQAWLDDWTLRLDVHN